MPTPLEILSESKLSNIEDGDFTITDGDPVASLNENFGAQLVHSAAFELLYSREGRQLLMNYYRSMLDVAYALGANYIIETPTWRANPDWVFRLGYERHQVTTINRHAAQFCRELQIANPQKKIYVSGSIGARFYGTRTQVNISSNDFGHYHFQQIKTLAVAGADYVTYIGHDIMEAIGIAKAAQSVNIPIVISLQYDPARSLYPLGLAHAIKFTDLETDGYVRFFMIHGVTHSVLVQLSDSWPSFNGRVKGMKLSQQAAQRNVAHQLASIRKVGCVSIHGITIENEFQIANMKRSA